jgi:hypothetical protein
VQLIPMVNPKPSGQLCFPTTTPPHQHPITPASAHLWQRRTHGMPSLQNVETGTRRPLQNAASLEIASVRDPTYMWFDKYSGHMSMRRTAASTAAPMPAWTSDEVPSYPGVLLLQDGRTALHGAAVNGHAEVMMQLLGVGAAVDAADKVRSAPQLKAAALRSMVLWCGKCNVALLFAGCWWVKLDLELDKVVGSDTCLHDVLSPPLLSYNTIWPQHPNLSSPTSAPQCPAVPPWWQHFKPWQSVHCLLRMLPLRTSSSIFIADQSCT